MALQSLSFLGNSIICGNKCKGIAIRSFGPEIFGEVMGIL
jgi:hypothetical protein